MVSNRNFVFQWSIFRGYVSFRECTRCPLTKTYRFFFGENEDGRDESRCQGVGAPCVGSCATSHRLLLPRRRAWKNQAYDDRYCVYIYSIMYMYIRVVYRMIQEYMIWYDVMWYDVMWYDMLLYDMIWYDIWDTVYSRILVYDMSIYSAIYMISCINMQ